MSKRTFIWFGVLVVVLAGVIPWLVFGAKGDSDGGERPVPKGLAQAQSLFAINCGNCHALNSAGADGNYGPDLDELLAPAGPPDEGETAEEKKTAEETIKNTEGRVLLAIEQGVDSTTTPGRMPARILNEEQAQEVAEFVARTAGEG
jgi:mono/diheme cytochrome c family protein